MQIQQEQLIVVGVEVGVLTVLLEQVQLVAQV
jgi:hypothetical protein